MNDEEWHSPGETPVQKQTPTLPMQMGLEKSYTSLQSSKPGDKKL